MISGVSEKNPLMGAADIDIGNTGDLRKLI